MHRSEEYSRHCGNLIVGKCLRWQRVRGVTHLVRKLLNLAKFSLGPAVDRVSRTGLTLSAALGEGNVAGINGISRIYLHLGNAYAYSGASGEQNNPNLALPY